MHLAYQSPSVCANCGKQMSSYKRVTIWKRGMKKLQQPICRSAKHTANGWSCGGSNRL